MKYPLGIQDFRKLREDGYAYVDKTEQICGVANTGTYFFLSRPRRFGKSLTLATLNELYSGSAELFEGLWAGEHWDFGGKQCPVIWLKFASMSYEGLGLEEALQHQLYNIAERLKVELPVGKLKSVFKDLIQGTAALSKTGRVVLLVDEYDKPILDYLDDVELAEKNRDVLRNLYSILKDADPFLDLVFITGVSTFAKVSIFSDLNNVRNLTVDPLAHTIVGLTQQELEGTFADQLAATGETKEVIKAWYNGYGFGANAERVYNPWSVLSFLATKELRNYWFETGMPKWLVKLMRDNGDYDIRGTRLDTTELSNFDLRDLNPIPVLFQTGYLTITEYVKEDFLYRLDYPNLEVRQSFNAMLLNSYLRHPRMSCLPRVVDLRNALREADLPKVVNIINAALAEIPYQHWKGKTEHFYHAIVHLMFSLLGTYIESDVSSSRGRCDAVVHTSNTIFMLEFKLDKSAAEALAQIHNKGYLQRYADEARKQVAVGINFSSEARQIVEWEAVEVDS